MSYRHDKGASVSSGQDDIPPLRSIARALRKTTEVLAQQLQHPTDESPDWTDCEWRLVRSVASIHGVSPLLSRALRWKGPEGWQRFLAEQRTHTFNRHQRIVQLLADVDTEARRAELAVIALKGAALHGIGIYEAGERPMADLDLLVRQADREKAFRVLAVLGYHLSFVTPKHWVFAPATAADCAALGEHSDNPIKIELHTSTTEWLPLAPVDVSEMIFSREMQPGVNPYASRAALMKHLLLHAAGNMRFRGLRLIHLHDIARLGSRMSSEDWREMPGAGISRPWWMLPPLRLTARYFPAAIPDDVLAAAEADCPWLLNYVSRRQNISDVSLSQLWIRAFPGIEWSRSAPEMLKYVVARISPTPQMLATRKDIARTSPWMTDYSWSRLSQAQRIVRWVRSRPPRVETISAVAAAWNQPG